VTGRGIAEISAHHRGILGLGQKEHEADRWVAATAIWLDVALVAHDAIFANVEGLNLLTKLGP